MSETSDTMGRTYFGKMLRGIMKLLMASFIIGLVSAITIPDLHVGDAVISGYIIKAILQFMIPIYLILSALEDMGVKFAIILVLLTAVGLLLPVTVVNAESPPYTFSPASCVDYVYSGGLIIMCPEDALLNGVEVYFSEPLYNSVQYNSVHVWIDYVNETSRVVSFHFTLRDRGFSNYSLSAGYYAGRYVYGFLVHAKFRDLDRNLGRDYYEIIQMTNRTLSYYWASWRFVVFKYKAVLEYPPQVELPTEEEITQEDWSPPDWWNFIGWVLYLGRIAGVVARGIGAGITLVATTIVRLVTLLPYLLVFIPLHLISAFLHSPESGMSALKFYYDIGRKIVSLLVQVAHAIASVINNILPT